MQISDEMIMCEMTIHHYFRLLQNCDDMWVIICFCTDVHARVCNWQICTFLSSSCWVTHAWYAYCIMNTTRPTALLRGDCFQTQQFGCAHVALPCSPAVVIPPKRKWYALMLSLINFGANWTTVTHIEWIRKYVSAYYLLFFVTFMFIPCILNKKCLLYANISTNK